jgi:xanthine/CO dehydrogenase XdhC/CoxF family maturation factor
MDKHTPDTDDILRIWSQNKRESAWAMAIIINTEGHSYRKTGAFALVNEKGEQLGMLSGGCLEADINLMARKCLSLDKIMTKEYDGRDEGDSAYQLGCGGVVWIRFIPLSHSENELGLPDLYKTLKRRQHGHYGIVFDESSGVTKIAAAGVNLANTNVSMPIKPKIHLLVVGGGKDAIPVCEFAKILSWQVTVWDPRSGYANNADFSMIDSILRTDATSLASVGAEQSFDFAILMSHNVEIDAKALQQLALLSLQHISLLGPKTRFQDVVASAGLDTAKLNVELSGPAGLAIGGDLPSSIALSIITQFHSIAYSVNALIVSDGVRHNLA